MAKVIKYKFLSVGNSCGSEQFFSDVIMGWSEANEEIAKREAYNGEYTIEDDGQPDPKAVPTQLDRVEAQVTYTAMMTDTLLEV